MSPGSQIVAAMNRIYKQGMTTTSGGNISMVDQNGNIWITPAGTDKGSLQPEDIVCIKPDGTVIGKHQPSSELPFHKEIYSTQPEIKAVIHAHPPGLVAFSIVHQIPDTNITPPTRECCGKIGYAQYELTGSSKLGEKIASEFRKGFKAIIMENHGAVVGGTNMIEAYQRFETLEYCSLALLYANTIGTPKPLTNNQINQFENQNRLSIPEMEKTQYSAEELGKRAELYRIIVRACDQKLVVGAFGTISARLSNDDFLITPNNIPLWNLQPEDLVRIKKGEQERGKTACFSSMLHREIYIKHPNIDSIIIAQPPYLMAYGISGQQVDVRTIPESWIFLNEIQTVPFSENLFNDNRVVELLSADKPVNILQNHSVLVTGNALIETFDRLEVAEFSAKSLVLAKSIGKLVPINDDQIMEMEKVFRKKRD